MDQFFQQLFSPGGQNSFQQQYEQSQAFAHQFFAEAEAAGRSFGTNSANANASANATGPPPASPKAIEDLEQITVNTPEELLSLCEPECTVCLEEFETGNSTLLRMPWCSHVFHSACLKDWLHRHNTCPTCRYELQTLDPEYEIHRAQRMKHVKRRISMHQLEQMSTQQLFRLCQSLQVSTEVTNHRNSSNNNKTKKQLLSLLLHSQKLTVLTPPTAKKYPLEELRAMSISKLKQCMRAAGIQPQPTFSVFLEKEELVKLLYQSGKVVLDDQWYDDAGRYGLQGYQVHHPDISPRNPITNTEIQVETVRHETEELLRPRNVEESAFDMFGSRSEEVEPLNNTVIEMTNDMTMNASISETTQHTMQEEEPDKAPTLSMQEEEPDETPPLSSSPQAEFTNKTIADLKCLASRLNIDISHCIEKSEMIDTLIAAGVSPSLQPLDFSYWSVSGLRALARELSIDLASHGGGDRDDMVNRLVNAANERPPVARYLNALMPLASLSTSELRGVAREWHRNVSDCLEKEEMIHRLVRGPSRQSF